MINSLLSLIALTKGESGIVKGFSKDMPANCRKLLQHLGITRQTEIKLIRKAPLGDPLQLQILGSQISLRASEAQYVYIEKKNND